MQSKAARKGRKENWKIVQGAECKHMGEPKERLSKDGEPNVLTTRQGVVGKKWGTKTAHV